MAQLCAHCDSANDERALYCHVCGTPLPRNFVEETTRSEQSALNAQHKLDANRDRAATGPQPMISGEYASIQRADTGTEGINGPPTPVERMPEGPRFSMGYDESNDLVIQRPNISGHHAVIVTNMNAYFIQDLESTNGTLVNGYPVEYATLHVGDHISLGSYHFVFDELTAERIQRRAKRAKRGDASKERHNKDLPRQITIGRDPDCDIVFDATQISRHHVCFTQTAYGWVVEDMGSINGTFVHDPHSQPILRAEVTERDVIFMGSYRFPVGRLNDFKDVLSSHKGTGNFELEKQELSIGRGDDSDIVVVGPQVSRKHARLVHEGDAWFIEDLNSANGTFINGERIKRAPLTEQDTISFGSTAVRLDLKRGRVQKSYQGDIVLQAENIRVDVDNKGKPKRLLDGISFTAYPTEFLGLMGPSGAGKTTLLMSMIGYLRPTYGRTLLNDDDLSERYDRYRGAIGYVPQEDIIHGELTVYEALYYTAKLRLPPDTSLQEIDRRINEVLIALEIEATRDVVIGGASKKGISGGQRKRVNLALELLTEPSLLCLDEPTSGLASEDALNVMRLLRRLADGGRTIVLTIHQPSLAAYRMMDNVLYLADGEQVYYGPTYPDSITYFNPEAKQSTPQAEELLADPGSCLLPLVRAKRAGEPMETFAARYRQSDYYAEYVTERRSGQAQVDITTKATIKRARFSASQMFTLAARALTIKYKDGLGSVILLVQAPIIAMLINLVFMFEPTGINARLDSIPFALFLLITSAIWFGCSNAAREIVSEQAIYRRERMVNLSLPAYIGSKFMVLAALSLVQCVTLLFITYFTLDIQGNPLAHLGILWLSALASTGMGLLLSSLVHTTQAALALVPLLLIPQVILGGAIMPIDRMSEPSWTMAQVMISRWGFEGMLHVEDASDAYEFKASALPAPLHPKLPPMPTTPHPVDRFIGQAEVGLPLSAATLGGFTLLFLLGTGFALKRKDM